MHLNAINISTVTSLIRLENKNYEALIDIGSNVSFISKDLYNMLNIKAKKLEEPVYITIANSDQMICDYYIDFNIKF